MTEPVAISGPTIDASRVWAPVDACTLPTVEQPLRVAEFDTLFAETLTSIERSGGTRARFVLIGGATMAERARDLADRETACCSFFAFAITPSGSDSVVMEVTVPDERADVLAALVQMAEEARQGPMERPMA